MLSIIVLVFVHVLKSQFANEQFSNDTLATVGSTVITSKDFLERFELMPWRYKEFKSRTGSIKQEFLLSLAAEKLLSLEAVSQRLGNDSVTVDMRNSFERLFVRDELYKRRVVQNLIVTDKEIQAGLKRLAHLFDLEIFSASSKEQADDFYRQFKRGKNKKAVLTAFRNSLSFSVDTVQLNFESSNPILEHTVYLMDRDSLSAPVEFHPQGWLLVHLLKKYPNDAFRGLSQADRMLKAYAIIKNRKEDSIAVRVFAAILSSRNAKVDSSLFFMLCDTVYAAFAADSNAFKIKHVYAVSGIFFEGLLNIFSAISNKTFVTITGDAPMTLKQVLVGLSNEQVAFNYIQKRHIQQALNSYIKIAVQNELLARDGLKNNLQYTKNVQHDLGTWMDNRKSTLLLRRIVDTITVNDEETETEYNKNPAVYGAKITVAVREILIDNADTAKQIFQRIQNGEEFAKLALRYSKRKEWAARGGDSGPVEVNTLGELGILALQAPIGIVQGPQRIKDGVTIFTVLERKTDDDSLRKNFTPTKQIIRQKILVEKKRIIVSRYVASLAKKYGVTFNEPNIKKLETTNINMFTWRMLGFGGRIAAAPQVIPQADWMKEFLKTEKLNQ